MDRCDSSPAKVQQIILQTLVELGGRPTYQVLIYHSAKKLKLVGELSTKDCRMTVFKACDTLFKQRMIKRVRRQPSYDAVVLLIS